MRGWCGSSAGHRVRGDPAAGDVPFSAWSLSKLADFPVAEVPYL